MALRLKRMEEELRSDGQSLDEVEAISTALSKEIEALKKMLPEDQSAPTR